MDAFKNPKGIKKGIISTTLVLLIIGLLQGGFEIINSLRNTELYKTPAYFSKAELESEFKKEKKKLGLENLAIGLTVIEDPNDPNFVSDCWYNNPNQIEVWIGKNNMKEGVLKHAVYHAYQMHNGEITRKKRWWNPLDTLKDWKATSYALKEDPY